MGVGAAPAGVPRGSTWLVDERGIGMKATWRLSHGFINLSIWRDDRCVETFHLAPSDAARLIGFLVNGLAEVASVPPSASVLAIAPAAGPAERRRLTVGLSALDDRLRASLAASLRRAADRLSR
jgi:hypothetical protein